MCNIGILPVQDRKRRVQEIETTLQEFEEVDSWQEEVSHLDRCLAWADPLAMRADIACHGRMVDDVVPKQIEEVRCCFCLNHI